MKKTMKGSIAEFRIIALPTLLPPHRAFMVAGRVVEG
jgi:hypothetical protein